METRTTTSGRPRPAPGRPFARYRTPTRWETLKAGLSSPRFERVFSIAGSLAMVLAPVVLLSFIAVTIVYVRLLHGPVSLKAFSARIEQGINDSLGGFSARIDDAVVALAEGRGIELQLINLRISERDGDLVATAPLAAVELDHGALLMLRAAPERVFLIEPRLSLLYREGQGLALAFADPQAGGNARLPSEAERPSAPAPAAPPPEAAAGETARAKGAQTPLQKLDLARILTENTARARSGTGATSSLREVGLRDAKLVVDYLGATSEWTISEGTIDLEHKRRQSVISGEATIESPSGPWKLSFSTLDSKKRNSIQVKLSVRDLVPRALAETTPQLALLEPLDMPLAGDLALDLSSAGEIKGATLALGVSPGRIDLPALSRAPLTVDGGQFRFAYDAVAHTLKVEPSTLAWGDSRIAIEGDMTREAGDAETPVWRFALRSTEGVLTAEEFGVEKVALDSWAASGRIAPGAGRIELAEFALKAGGATVGFTGEIESGTDAATRIEGTMSPMTLPTLKVLWPRAIAPGARMWVGQHVTGGALHSGTIKILSGRFLAGDSGGGPAAQRISMAFEAGDLRMTPLPDGLPVEAPRALIRLENNALEVTIPESAIVTSPGKKVPLKSGRFTVREVDTPVPVGELAFQVQTSLGSMLDIAGNSPHVHIPLGDLRSDAIEGKVEGQFQLTMPLVPSLDPTPPKIAGKARVADIRIKQRIGQIEVQGGTIDVDVSETAAIAGGELIVNGVLAKLEMQRIFDVPADMQPPIRLTASLDNADRLQLGLDVNHLVQGEVPIDVTIAPDAAGNVNIHARADLTNAELSIHDLAWRKPQGRAAFMDVDVDTRSSEKAALKNFRIAGDDIAIEGWLGLDKTNEVDEFHFPNFSLNLVSRLEVQGKLSASKIWNIKARGTVYDGRDLFRSLLSIGRSAENEIKPQRPSAGMDFEAKVDTVLGHSDVSLRGFSVKLSERGDALTKFEAQGTLDGGKPLNVVLKKEANGARFIYADSPDAGQAMKAAGFYPNMQGGRVRLSLNLDATGAADTSGVLEVNSFRVLGDPIVSEVYSSGAKSSPTIDGVPQGERKVVREVFEFDRMKVPFSVGHGQFVIEESYVKGPLIGASVRGKVDYGAQRVNLGGTYVPLQGITAGLCEIPLFGPIILGPGCEGMFGITYAIQGPMNNPQVIVNPLSMLTPGIFRGIMEMTNPNPKVLPREAPKQSGPGSARASSSTVTSGKAGKAKEAETRAGDIDGWSSETDGMGSN